MADIRKFGSDDLIELRVDIIHKTTRAGLPSLANVRLVVVYPDGADATPTAPDDLFAEVNATLVEGAYKISVDQANLKGGAKPGIFSFKVDPNDANAAKMFTEQFEVLAGVSTTSPSASFYGTFSGVKELIDTDKTQGEVEIILARVTERIERVTGYVFQNVPLKLEINGTGNRNLYLRKTGLLGTNQPVISIDQILRRDRFTDDFDVSATVLDPEIYRAKGHLIVLQVPEATIAQWLEGHRNYRVDGNFGWAAIPDDIHLAGNYLAAADLNPGFWKGVEAVQESWGGDYSYSLPAGVIQSGGFRGTGVGPADRLLVQYLNRRPRIGGMRRS